MYLSKSKYCNAVQCQKMLWLKENKPEEMSLLNNDGVFDKGNEVGSIAKGLFGPYEDIKFNEKLDVMVLETNKLLTRENVIITEASFVFENNFCSVDILVKKGHNFEIYEVKSSSEVKDIYLDDISYQVYILKNLGFNVTKACIVHLNNYYIRKGKLDLQKLFIIKDVTDIAFNKQDEVKNKIKAINEYMEAREESQERLGMHCVKPYDCPFFKYCAKNLNEFNVFNIRGMQKNKKFELYNKGLYTYEDLLKLKLNENYREQIEFDLYDKKPSINKKAIKDFLDTLSYPLYFLDFETYQSPIPEYDDTWPNMQIPFQYSLHYLEKENGVLKHKEFLAKPNLDPRRNLALSLVNDIPLNVCTIAYNMRFEKSVIKNLADIYPDLRKHLMNIHDNIHDLMIPFQKRMYYQKEMHGSYSIKEVLPALFPSDPNLDYHNLDLIHNGSEAMNTYANMGNMNNEESQKVKYSLLKYCELDTLAMVKIWEKLKETVDI